MAIGDIDRTWDVVVIGAGPAGALAARRLAQTGARTLLVDRKPFPRAKVCGACINEKALTILRSAGLDELVDRLGGQRLRGFHVQSCGRRLRLELPGGIAVSRRRFDMLLAEAAVKAGTTFLPETTAIVAEASTDLRTVQVRGAGQQREIRARVVVVASGLACPGLDRRTFRSRVQPGSRIGLGATVAEFPGDYAPGTIYMAVGRDGYAGLVRVEDGQLNIAAAVDAAAVRKSASAAEVVAGLLREAGLPAIRGLGSADWRGTAPLTRTTEPVAAHRVFVIGDAAGYVEPFTGEGIAWGLASAQAVAPLARAAVDGWEPRLAGRWNSFYRQSIRRRQRWCRWLAAGLRSPVVSGALLRAVSLVPTVARPIVDRVSGTQSLHGNVQ